MRYVDVTSHHFSRILKESGQLIVTQEMIRTGARGYADGADDISFSFLLFPLTSLRFSPSWWYGHWLATGTQLWQSGDESQGSYRVPN
jgi:hypothetical protein